MASYTKRFLQVVLALYCVFISVLQNQKNLRSTIQSSDVVTVKRIMINDDGDENEEWERISSEDLVPGDIILIPTNGCEMSCDAIVLSGTAIGWYPNFIES